MTSTIGYGKFGAPRPSIVAFRKQTNLMLEEIRVRKTLMCFSFLSMFALLTGVAGARVKKPPNYGPRPASSAAPCDTVAGNIVANCSFGTGDFTSWVQSGDLSYTAVNAACGPAGGSSNCAFLGSANHLGLLTQIVPTPGAFCTLSFWVLNSGQPSEFEVWFGGRRVSAVLTQPDHDYVGYTLSGLFATGGATDLTFAFFNAPSYTLLADIVVTCP
jgi:hypothetical protein